jgi:arylformamidase
MLYDITPPLRPGIPVWPGDTPYTEQRTWSIGPDGVVNVSKVGFSTHTGAHADAPLHYDETGAAIGVVPLETYLGPCRVIDARGFGAVIEPHHLNLQNNPPRLLFRTFAQFPLETWVAEWTTFAPAAITAMGLAGVKLVGMDGPSLDPQDSKTMDAHMAVRAAGLAILEGLYLDDVPPGDYELIALPLKFANLDASPVRAVLRSPP